MHCFSYSRELAREYLDMGLYLGDRRRSDV